ncbi:MAG: NADH:flavin oxidoreductase [Syntrophorhabdales bacterium]|jgi:2,4-dienoyl-CoA reductase-like NADH-dependent reductase (Old Yellow Enzyme family)
MATLFETTALNTMELHNRFVRSATWEGLAASGGYPTERLTGVLVDLAKGGVAMIITGHAYVSPEGQAGPFQLGIHGDDRIAPLLEMTKAVHASGGKIVVQLAHAGCRAASELTGTAPLGPSPLEQDGRQYCGGMTRDELRRLTEAFGRAAARAQEAGFDGAQVHAAHGYLMSQFLSPLFNRRNDDYGGSVENRARALLDVVEAIRSAVGGTFPLMVKINSEDYMDGGFTVEEMLSVSAMLEKAGVDAIEMSGGTFYSGAYMPSRTGQAARVEGEAYYYKTALRYKEKIRVPLILVGGIRSYDAAEGLIAQGAADYIALCRPLIAEPDLVNRWKSGNRERAACKSDNLCFKPGFEGRGVYCVTGERQRDRKA